MEIPLLIASLTLHAAASLLEMSSSNWYELHDNIEVFLLDMNVETGMMSVWLLNCTTDGLMCDVNTVSPFGALSSSSVSTAGVHSAQTMKEKVSSSMSSMFFPVKSLTSIWQTIPQPLQEAGSKIRGACFLFLRAVI